MEESFHQELLKHPPRECRLRQIEEFTNKIVNMPEMKMFVPIDIDGRMNSEIIDRYVDYFCEFINHFQYDFGWCMLSFILFEHYRTNRVLITRKLSFAIQIAISKGYGQVEFYLASIANWRDKKEYMIRLIYKTYSWGAVIYGITCNAYQHTNPNNDLFKATRHFLFNREKSKYTELELSYIFKLCTPEQLTPFGQWIPKQRVHKWCCKRVKEEILTTLLVCKRYGVSRDVSNLICGWVCTI